MSAPPLSGFHILPIFLYSTKFSLHRKKNWQHGPWEDIELHLITGEFNDGHCKKPTNVLDVIKAAMKSSSHSQSFCVVGMSTCLLCQPDFLTLLELILLFTSRLKVKSSLTSLCSVYF